MLIRKYILSLIVFSAVNAQKTAKEVSISNVNKALTYYIVFEKNKTELSIEAKQKLDKICKVFQNNPTDSIDIKSGLTQNTLYKERSISVNTYLLSKGVSQGQIRYVEYGKLKTSREIELILKE